MPETRYLYIAFFSTPCKMGKLIRTVTRYPYNHVSVSLDPELKTFYSFARYYRNAPFYAGFVRESCLRYKDGGECSSAKICAIPISEKLLEDIRAYLEGMSSNSGLYTYNLFSAVCYPIHKRVRLERSYTCVEFAVDLMQRFSLHPELMEKRFYSIEELDYRLRDHLIYAGPITGSTAWGADTFPDAVSLWSRVRLTCGANGRLISSGVRTLRVNLAEAAR